MSYSTDRQSIRGHFASRWTGTALSLVCWDDQEFDPPSGEPWVHVSINHTSSQQLSIGSPGSNMYQRNGTVTVRIYVPEGGYAITATEMGDEAADIFESTRTEEGISFHSLNLAQGGSGHSGFHAATLTVGFISHYYA